MKKILFFLILALGMASCHKDTEDTTIIEDVYTPPVIKVNGTIAGLVADEQGNGIEGATVRVGNQQQQTGPGGYFLFRNIVLDANGTFVKVDEANYFHASRRIFPKANSTNYTTLTLMSKSQSMVGSVDASTGGTLNVNGGASVKLPANGIVSADGSAYSGSVSVAARWLDPSARNMVDIMPGNLQAINANDEEVALASYGMIAVELTSSNGSRLQLGNGAKAELTFPIPASLSASAPSEIPLWHFDENTGLWRQDGKAIRQGNVYVGEVSHFSFWNCDAPFPVVSLEGRITDGNGTVMPGITVRISFNSGAQTGYGSSNDDGVFSGKVPANEALVLTIVSDCGTIALETPIGPFSQDVNIGDFDITNTTIDFSTISGTLENCDGDPVTNGIVRVCRPASGYCSYILAESDGTFSGTVSYCSESNLEIAGFDMTAALQSATQTPAATPTINTGAISVCDSQLDEYFTLTVNGNSNTYLLPYMGNAAGALNYVGVFGPDSTYTAQVSFPVGAVGSYSGAGVSYHSFQSDPTFLSGHCNNPCSAITVNITEFGNVGEFVRGNFSGTLDFYDASQQLVPNLPVSGSFSVIRLQ